MKIVTIGAGEVGHSIAKALYANNDIILIDKRDEACERANDLDVQVIQGNGANINILKRAFPADLVVAVTGNDEVNIVACIAAKLLSKKGARECMTIARVSSPDYINKPITNREQIGIDHMICPELTLASVVTEIISIPSAVSMDEFAEGKVEMIEFKVGPDTALDEVPLADAKIPDCCVISALIRGKDVIIPHGGDVMREGDHVIVIGKPESISEIGKLFGDTPNQHKKVMIIGAGIVGFYIAKLLAKHGDTELKIIEADAERCVEIADMLPSALVLHGDGTDEMLLKSEGVAEMDVVIAATDSDERNLLCLLLAKQLGARKIIAKVDRSEYMGLFERVGIDAALSPKYATINSVLRVTAGAGVESLAAIEEKQAELVELVASPGAKITKKTLARIKFPKGAIIGMIVRRNEVIVPRGTHQIQAGDRVVVFALASAMAKVKKLFV
ncbi:MAG: Trk system potassium transporter TrkA [Methanosarcinales archaeon]|nr:MAG: Trk system potassium transporter TrkA [Methanosarcinales archaeon]